ncbi:hypothetical protein SUGI_0905540 [Cryptomeria japonica]|nr:hypothetical protein SUGI_0905540 [Cryptomeria japonica]
MQCREIMPVPRSALSGDSINTEGTDLTTIQVFCFLVVLMQSRARTGSSKKIFAADFAADFGFTFPKKCQ